MNLTSDRLVCLEGLIPDLQDLSVDDGFKERRDVLQPFEVEILLKTYHAVLGTFEVEGVFKFAEEFFHPLKMRHTLEAVKHEDSLFELLHLIISDRHFLDGELGVGVMVVGLLTVLHAFDVRTITSIGLHVIEVEENLPTANGHTLGESVKQGFRAGVRQLFPPVAPML